MALDDGAGGLPAAFLTPGSASFVDFLGSPRPELLPGAAYPSVTTGQGYADVSPHGTTIVASTFAGGVVMAGDRRATMGNVIAQRDIEKVHAADAYSMVGIAGTAGLAMELVRTFQLELEHYEKIEGATLSILGKANRLSTLIRANLAMALQGLAVVPLFAGYDLTEDRGRIFSYDVTGGRYEEHDFYAVGSGSMFARGSLKKLYQDELSEQRCAQACVEALFDAADDDSATGGPDLFRKIYPLVAVADVDGVRVLPDSEIAAVVADVVQARYTSPDGPKATLTGLDGGDER